MNGHFAAVGDGPTAQHYEHGIQVIDEEKAFKCVMPATRAKQKAQLTSVSVWQREPQ
jgi:hypothetical protein